MDIINSRRFEYHFDGAANFPFNFAGESQEFLSRNGSVRSVDVSGSRRSSTLLRVGTEFASVG